jgi:hypothetical protein
MTQLHPLFVADVLEGFEGTLDEVVGRVESLDLNMALDALRSRVTMLRVRIEEAAKRTEAEQATLGI